jgi:hypothetical protein
MGNFAQFFWSSTMKQVLIATTLALACAATFAQTPATAEPGKTPISAKAGAAAEAKVEARKEAGTGTAMQTPAVPERGAAPASAKTAAAAEKNVDARKSASHEAMKPMDTNGDGMVSRTEYNNYHASMWKKMKMTKGQVAQSDMQEMMKLGAASQ